MTTTHRTPIWHAAVILTVLGFTWASLEAVMAAEPREARAQPRADAKAGAAIATQGIPNTAAAACISCHGVKGEGNAAAGFPKLAGMSSLYLQRQLAAYASGSRPHPVMSPIAKALTHAQQKAVSTYLAGLGADTAMATNSSHEHEATPSRGSALASRGDEALHVQACANCHGPGGVGEGMAAPPLAGQHATYLKAALQTWKDGSRKTDSSGQMPSIAAALSDQDMEALAQYYASLPGATSSRSAPSNKQYWKAHKKVPSGPRPAANAKAPQGIGTEQGSPTTGGAQGPGGGGGGTGSGATGSKGGTP